MRKQVHGILLLNKPIEMTSNRVLQKVKYLFNAKKAGHTGSLDPIATGMLPICFGEATKFSQFLLDSNKTYYVVAKLGVTTNTGDREGEVTARRTLVDITPDRIEQVMTQFLGEISQIPPMYSALKHQGQPLYKLARAGIEIEREARTVKIFSLKLISLNVDECAFEVHCSKGTYIRTLVEDIGKELGCGAHVIELHRMTVSPYDNKPMYTLAMLEAENTDHLTQYLLPIETAVQAFPAVKLSTSAAFYMRMGQAVRATFPLSSSLVRLISDDAKFLGLGEVMSDGRVKPHRLIASNG